MKRVISPAARNLIISIFLLVVVSSLFYHFAEGWSWIDAYYFTVITITTVGHAALIPTTAASKIFTSLVAFIGIAMVLTLFGILSSHYVRMVAERNHKNNLNNKVK